MNHHVNIHIISALRAQNDLLCGHIRRELKFRCGHYPRLSFLPADIFNSAGLHVLLIDCSGKDIGGLMGDISVKTNGKGRNIFSAFFNLSLENRERIEKEAIRRGVKGIFPDTASLDQLSKGILRILKGELWFSRDTLSDCLTSSTESGWNHTPPNAAITRRETEILCMIASGATNAQIAEKLFLSPHTVRTHLYNLYKKINVPNRLQASIWAREHLPPNYE